MYLIINKTTKTNTSCFGNYPISTLESLLSNNNKIIVISLYSNTIKIPYSVIENGITTWEWEDYEFDYKQISKLTALNINP